jgi:nitrate reductase assembly molybdenum cofactor insertion protein NarJ
MTTESRLTDIESMIAALNKRVRELEKENVLLMRALAKLTEERAEEVESNTRDLLIPGTIPEPENSGN